MSQNFNGTVTTAQRAIGAKLRFDAKYLARCFMAAWDDGLGHPPRQSLTVEQVKFPPNVRRIMITASNYKCSHLITTSGDRWPDDMRLVEPSS